MFLTHPKIIIEFFVNNKVKVEIPTHRINKKKKRKEKKNTTRELPIYIYRYILSSVCLQY